MFRTSITLVFILNLFAPVYSQDCTPRLTLFNGISANITALDIDGNLVTDDWGVRVDVTDLIISANSPCGSALTYGISKNWVPTSNFPETTELVFNCDELGPQPVAVYIKDELGNVAVAETYVLVQGNVNSCDNAHVPHVIKNCTNDVIAPQLKIINGVVANIVQTPSGEGRVRVSAGALMLGREENCPGFLRVRIEKLDSSTGAPPTTSYIELDCDEVVINPIRIWACDPALNWDYVDTYVIVEDLDGICGSQEISTCTPDNTPPAGLVLNGIAKPILPDGTVELNALSFIWRISENCSNVTSVGISLEDLPDPPVGQQSVVLENATPTPYPVFIWYADADGNWSETVTYVLLSSSEGFKGAPFYKKPFLNDWWESIPNKK
ncbi:MAG: hypothetical protein R2792_20525 [Saprospiraceae bacterium]